MAKKTDENAETAAKKGAAKKGAAKAPKKAEKAAKAPKKAEKAAKAAKAPKKAEKAAKAPKKGAAKAPKAEKADGGAIHHKAIFPHVGKLGGCDAMKAYKASGSSEDLAHVLHHAMKTFAAVKGSKAKAAEVAEHFASLVGGKKK